MLKLGPHIYVQTFVWLWGYMHVSIALAYILKVILMNTI